MGLGGAAVITNQKREPGGGGPPFPANAADNGLSVDTVTGEIVLGQDSGALGDPALLLSTRQIPMNGFSVDFTDVGAETNLFAGFISLLNPGQSASILFDRSVTAGGLFEMIPPGTYPGQKNWLQAVQNPIPNGDGTVNNPMRWGWFNSLFDAEVQCWYSMEPHFTPNGNVENHLVVTLPGTGNAEIRLFSNTFQPGMTTATSVATWDHRATQHNFMNLLGDTGVVMDIPNTGPDARLGIVAGGMLTELGNNGSANQFEITPQSPVAGSRFIVTNFDVATINSIQVTPTDAITLNVGPLAHDAYTLGFGNNASISGNAYQVGYISRVMADTGLFSDQPTDLTAPQGILQAYGFDTGAPSRNYFIVNTYDAGAHTAHFLVKEGGKAIFGDVPLATIPVQQVEIRGGLAIADTVLVHNTVAFTNGAGASVGTLTNAPAAGNPTKWIPVDDNGTTRFIPAW